jgi:hypothetical protein
VADVSEEYTVSHRCYIQLSGIAFDFMIRCNSTMGTGVRGSFRFVRPIYIPKDSIQLLEVLKAAKYKHKRKRLLLLTLAVRLGGVVALMNDEVL